MKEFYYGFNPPFIGGPQNILSRQVNERLIKNDLLQLLLTSPGERVMRPTFGTGIKGMLFESMDAFTVDSLRADVLEAIAQHEPRVDVVSLRMFRDDARHGLQISLVVKLKLDPTQIFTINKLIELQGV